MSKKHKRRKARRSPGTRKQGLGIRRETSKALHTNLIFILKCVCPGRFLNLRTTWPEAYKIPCLVLYFSLNFPLLSTHIFLYVFFSASLVLWSLPSSAPWSVSSAPYVKWGLHCLSHWSTALQSKRNWDEQSEHHLLFLATWKNNKCKTVRSQQYCFNSIFKWVY